MSISSSTQQEFDYKEYLSLFNVQNDDIVDVASDLFSIWDYCKRKHQSFNANHFIDAMIETFGTDTTIMIRTFNWDFCHGVPFDMRRTPSKVGLLGNIALHRKDFRRTKHPLYSWMVIGPRQDEICNLDDPKAFGEGSMFDYLYQNDGKAIGIGNTDTDVMTQTHHCEVLAKVPYRRLKKFTGEYISADGEKSIKTYYMQVRPLNIDVEEDIIINNDKESTILANELETRKIYDGLLNARTYYIRPFQEFMVHYFASSDGSWLITSDGKPGYASKVIDWSKAVYE